MGKKLLSGMIGLLVVAVFGFGIVALFAGLTGCHRQPVAVVAQPAPDYTVNSSYAEPVYDPGATVVCIGGRRGYYDSYRVFHPVVVVGGFEGYYDSRHRFVSSAPGIRTRVQPQVRVQVHITPPPIVAPVRPNVAPPRQVARSSPQPARIAPRAPPPPAPVARSGPTRTILNSPAPAARSGPSGGGRRK